MASRSQLLLKMDESSAALRENMFVSTKSYSSLGTRSPSVLSFDKDMVSPSPSSRYTDEAHTAKHQAVMLEKEAVESEKRSLKVETATLKEENKWLRGKINKANSRVREVEASMTILRNSNDELQERLMRSESKSRQDTDLDKQQLYSKVATLSREVEIGRAKNESYEKQAESSKKTIDMLRKATDRSKIVESYEKEIAALRDELNTTRALMQDSDRQHKADLQKLSDANNILRTQMDTPGRSAVSDKELKSLERRLKVTDERLQQERSDRASSLSTIEEKLLSEKCRLELNERELKRNLQREKEKNRSLEERVKFMRAELEGEAPRPKAMKMETEEEAGPLRQSIRKLEQQLNDSEAQKDEVDKLLNKKVTELVRQKHDLQTQVARFEDVVAGLRAENEVLKHAEVFTPRSHTPSMESNKELASRAQTAESQYQQELRQNKLMENELISLRAQLEAKHQQITYLQNRESRMSMMSPGGTTDTEQLKSQMRGLQAELRLWTEKCDQFVKENSKLRDEVDSLKGRSSHALSDSQALKMFESKKHSLEKEVHEKETRILELLAQYQQVEEELQQSKRELATEKSVVAELTRKMGQLEDMVSEKQNQLSGLSGTSSDQQLLLHAKMTQIEDLQKRLREKSEQADFLRVQTEGQNTEVFELKKKLTESSEELTSLRNKNRLTSAEIDEAREKIAILEKQLNARTSESLELRKRDENLIQQLSSETKHRDTQISEVERRVTVVETEKQSIQRQFEESEETVRKLVRENSSLVEQLDKMRYNNDGDRGKISQLDDQIRMLTMERDRHAAEKSRLELSLQENFLKLKKSEESFDSRLTENQSDFRQRYSNMELELKKVAMELDNVKRISDEREQEITVLCETVEKQNVQTENLKKNLGYMQQENDELRGKIKDADKLKKLIDDLNNEKSKLLMDNFEKVRDGNDLKQQLNAKLTEVEHLKARLEDLTHQSSKVENKVEEKNGMVLSLSDQLQHARQALDNALHEKSRFQEIVQTAKGEIQVLRAKVDALEDNIRASERALSEEKTLKGQCDAELTETQKILSDLRNEKQKIRNHVQATEKKAKSLSNQKDRVEEDKKTLQSTLDGLKMQLTKETSLRKEAEDKLIALVDESKRKLSDVSALRQQLEVQKMTYVDNNKRLAAEVKMIKEDGERERNKLNNVAQELRKDVERMREQLSSKHQENVRLHEEIFKCEEKIHEYQGKVRLFDEQIAASREMESAYQKKLKDLDSENRKLSELKFHLEDRAHTKTVDLSRSDVLRAIHDLSEQIKMHNETKSSSSSDQQSIVEIERFYKVQLMDVESSLRSERDLHKITQNELRILRENNQHLRQQLLHMKRGSNSPDSRVRRNRMEEINSRIASAQALAQTYLTSFSNDLSETDLTHLPSNVNFRMTSTMIQEDGYAERVDSQTETDFEK